MIFHYVVAGNNDSGPCDDINGGNGCFNGGYCREDPRLPDGAECVCTEEYDGEFCQYRKIEILHYL